MALDSAGVDDGRELPSCPPAQELLLSFPAVTSDEVIKLIRNCPTKSCPLDPMPTWLLKDDSVLQSIAPAITQCINASLGSGTFPASLKKAIVTPLIKKLVLTPT